MIVLAHQSPGAVTEAPGTGEPLKKEKAAMVIKKIMKLFIEDPRDNFLIISDYRSLWLGRGRGVYNWQGTYCGEINFTTSPKVIICFMRIPGEANAETNWYFKMINVKFLVQGKKCLCNK